MKDKIKDLKECINYARIMIRDLEITTGSYGDALPVAIVILAIKLYDEKVSFDR